MIKPCFSLLLADVDECSRESCGSNSDCLNTVGSFNCVCTPGYVMDGRGNCVQGGIELVGKYMALPTEETKIVEQTKFL